MHHRTHTLMLPSCPPPTPFPSSPSPALPILHRPPVHFELAVVLHPPPPHTHLTLVFFTPHFCAGQAGCH